MVKVPERISRRTFCTAALATAFASSARAQQGALVKAPPPLGSARYLDRRLGTGLPERGWQVYLSRTLRKASARDPKYNFEYPYAVGVNVITDIRDQETSGERRFEINYAKKEDEPLARRIGSVMARLHWLSVDYLGVSAGRAGTSVWLARDGEAGAEESGGNIWVHAIDTPRAPAEWLRELAHEFAHATLPTLGPYSKPERWANGYLGERLYLKWMLHDNLQTDVWSEPIDAEGYIANQVTPLRDLFLAEGPSSPRAELTDADGMNFLIGQFMALEAAHGPALLRELIGRIRSPSPKGLHVNLAASIRALEPAVLPIAPAVFIPESAEQSEPMPQGGVRAARVAYRLYVPSGDWTLEAEGDVPQGANVSLDGAALTRVPPRGVVAGAWSTMHAADESGWRRLEVAAPDGKKVELSRLRLTRDGSGSG
ncbi:MAG: hypothetical protein ACO1SX_27545 [Actinomycetota bacterium]